MKKSLALMSLLTFLSVGVPAMPINTPPTVDAGNDFAMLTGSSAFLSGSAIDVDGDDIATIWSQIAGVPFTIVDDINPLSQVQSPGAVAIGGVEVTLELLAYDGTDIVTDTVDIWIYNAGEENSIPARFLAVVPTPATFALIALGLVGMRRSHSKDTAQHQAPPLS